MSTTTLPAREHKSTKNKESQTPMPTRTSPGKQVQTDGAGEVVVTQATIRLNHNKLKRFKS